MGLKPIATTKILFLYKNSDKYKLIAVLLAPLAPPSGGWGATYFLPEAASCSA